MISSSPNQLHIYDASSQADTTVALTGAPLNFSLGPDGLHAAVAYSNSVDYVNLQSGAIEKNYAVAITSMGSAYSGPTNGTVVLGTTNFYVLSGGYESSIRSVDLVSGVVTPFSKTILYSNVNIGRYNPATKTIYSSDGYFYSYDASTGPITDYDSTNNYSSCNNLWFSADNSRIYTGCATVISASSDRNKDKKYVTSFSSLRNGIQAFSESAAIQRIAVVPQSANDYYIPQTDSEIRLFDNNYLNAIGRFALQPFTVGTKTYNAHGRFVFFNQAGNALYALNQADSTSGLINDFAIQKISLTAASSCTVTLAHATLSAGSPGAIGTADITAAADCIYQASSDSVWIKVLSGNYGSGNTKLTYLIRPNSTSASRTGTISVGGRSLTLTQDATAPLASLNPLSYKVLAADYSKSLDKLVLISGSSNELHLYDAVSGTDQPIDLPAAPLYLSVRPDGEYAAVGHNGWVSYVNLRLQAVEQIIPIPTSVSNLILAGNSYLYVFATQYNSGLYYRRLGDAEWATLPNYYSSITPRLHPSGKYIYFSSGSLSKLDISNGTPTAVPNVLGNYNGCSSVWLSEDGQRLFTSCGTVLRTTESTDDLSANGSFSSTNGVTWAAQSAQQHRIAVLTSPSYYYNGESNNTRLQLYADDALAFIGDNTIPEFSVGSSFFTGYGRFVFWNTAASKLILVEQADNTAGLLSDYAVYILDAGSGPASCSYQLSTTQFSLGAATSNTIAITVTTQAGCGWTATSDSGWINFYSSNSGSGTGTAQFGVSSNTTTSVRTATIKVAGQVVSISQTAATPCSNTTVYPLSFNYSSAGGNGSSYLTTDSLCGWTAISSMPSWLTITGSANGSGQATTTFSVAPNLGLTVRTGTILVAGKVLTVTQSGNTPTATSRLRFLPLAPCRVVDTRLANGDFGSPALVGQSSRDFAIPAGSCGIPNTAFAYSLNVTVVPHGPLSYLTIWPTGSTRPVVSTLNSYDGRVRANAAIIPAGEDGKISVFATNDTEVVLDVNGYFVQDYSALVYFPLTPCRVADTRLSAGFLGGPNLSGGQNRTLPLRNSSCNIPTGAQAYALNYTVVPQKPLGYLTTWPTGQERPAVSTVNSPTGVVTANAAIVPAGVDGAIDVYASDDTDLVVDITGYFAASGANGGLSLYTVTPCRAFDSRTTSTGQPYTGQLDIKLQASSCNLPFFAQAYALNATVVPSTNLGYLTLWPSGVQQPVVSTLNSTDGAVTANMAITTTQNGSVSSFVTDKTHLILDVTGYFAP